MSLEKPTNSILPKSSSKTEQFNNKVRKIADILMQPHPDIQQIFGGMYVREKATGKANKNKVCAMGLLIYHSGYKSAVWDDIVDFHCGIKKCPFTYGNDLSVYTYIIHLNDHHHLTFYQIGKELLKLID